MSTGARPRQSGQPERKRKLVPPPPAACVCRVCMGQGDSMALLRDTVVEKIVFCTGLQIAENDGFPKHICYSCSCLLDSAHLFKATCLNSDAEFRGTVRRAGGQSVHSDRDDWMVEDECEVKPDWLEARRDNNSTDPLECHSRVSGKRRERKSKEENCNINNVDKFDSTNIYSQEKLIILNPAVENKASLKDLVVTTEHSFVKRDGKTQRGARWRRTQPLYCQICDAKFPDIPAAQRHAAGVHKWDLCSVCEHCGKMFKQRGSYKCHMRSHRPDTYFCDGCSYSTCRRQDLVKHMWTHSGLRKFQCELCPATHRTTSALRSHVRRAHERRRDHACAICARTFFDRQKLQQHLDLHNGVKPYTCDVCRTTFSRRETWTKHMKTLHGEPVGTLRLGHQKNNSNDVEKPPSSHVATVGQTEGDREDAADQKDTADQEDTANQEDTADQDDTGDQEDASNQQDTEDNAPLSAVIKTMGVSECQFFTVGLSNTVQGTVGSPLTYTDQSEMVAISESRSKIDSMSEDISEILAMSLPSDRTSDSNAQAALPTLVGQDNGVDSSRYELVHSEDTSNNFNFVRENNVSSRVVILSNVEWHGLS